MATSASVIHNGVASEDYLLWGWSRFFEELSSFLQATDRQAGIANQAFSEYVLERLEISVMSVSTLINHLQSTNNDDEQQAEVGANFQAQLAELLRCLRDISQQWQQHLDHYEANMAATSYSAPVVRPHSRQPGRPRFHITREQLQYLASMSFSWTQIAQILGVSQMTIYRRRVEYGMLNYVSRNITDEELRVIVDQIRRDLPTLGETMMWGHLRSMGFRIARERVRCAIRETDPLHTALRWRGDITRRRPYSVPGPNSLWHIGKLI